MQYYIGSELIFDPDVKLEKIELTQAEYDALTSKKDNVLYIITDASNPLDELTDKVDKHLQNTTNGLNHIPDGGHERQILAWQANGKAKWDDLANMFTGLEELLAYGVEWDVNVADPHITRIGNMSLHKTLPIQSQLKGCIAQKDKVMYWLAEDDWRFRKDPQIVTVDLTTSTETITLPSVVGLGVNQYLRNENCIAKITAIDDAANTVTVEWELPEVAEGEEPIDLTAITSLEIGSRLDGYDGTVRVYCPSFYIKSKIIGDKRQVWLSTVKIDNTWTYQPEILIDAYRSTVLNTVPENMGYLSTLPANSAISVVNTATYCRGGGDRSDYDKYLTGTDGTEIDIFRTDLGKPRTKLNRPTMRTYSRNAGNEMLSYNQYKNIFYWLYVVEYANFNCQATYKEQLTADGYRQGGLGDGVTTWDGTNWNNYNRQYPLTPCGFGNDLGNHTGIKDLVIPQTTATASKTFKMPRWRGFDNPFGDIWTNLDGIIIDADANNHPDNMNYVYTTDDPAKYGDTVADMAKMRLAGLDVHETGFVKQFDLGTTGEIIPKVMGGSTTTHKCDYHWAGGKDTTLRTLAIGGNAADSGYAGLSDFLPGLYFTWANADLGFRTVNVL